MYYDNCKYFSPKQTFFHEIIRAIYKIDKDPGSLKELYSFFIMAWFRGVSPSSILIPLVARRDAFCFKSLSKDIACAKIKKERVGFVNSEKGPIKRIPWWVFFFAEVEQNSSNNFQKVNLEKQKWKRQKIFELSKDYSVHSGAPARRSRASRAPFLRNFGKLIKPRKFDVTVRTSVCTDSKRGEWSLKVTLTGKFKNAMFSWRDFLKKKTHFYLLCQQTIGEVGPTFSR